MPYRILTVIFLAALIATRWIPLTERTVKELPPPASGVIYFDPCDLVGQMPISTKVAGLTFLSGIITVAAKGLFNRRAPWWAALAFIAGWVWILERQSYSIQHCWTARDHQIAALQTAIIIVWSLCHLRSPRPI